MLEEPGRVAFESMKQAREEADKLNEQAGMIAPQDVPLVGRIWGVNAATALGYNMVRHPQYTTTQLAASLAAQMTSPADAAANLISFGVAGAAKSIIKAATLNAVSNASAQALLSGPKQLSYQSAGLPYGWEVWAQEVGAAAGAGFMLDAAIRTPGRAAIRRFGRDTPSGTKFSRNTERGGFFTDAITDVTPTPRPRDELQISPETIKRAEEGDIAASREILEKTGAMEDPAVRYAVEHMEGGGRLTDDQLKFLEKNLGVARADGVRIVANAMLGKMPDGALPEPIRAAPEPMQPERGAALLERMQQLGTTLETLPPRLRAAVEDGLESGVPRIVNAVQEAIDSAPENLSGKLSDVLDERTVAEARMHAGRAGPVEMAQAFRKWPDLVDSNVPIEHGPIADARAIAGMDDVAFAEVARGAVPSEVVVLIADRIPLEQQARMVADIERAQPRSVAEAASLIEDLRQPRVPLGQDGAGLAPGARIVDPAGPEAKARTEALRQEAGQAYEDAMQPIRRRDELEGQIEDLRGKLAKLEMDQQPEPRGDGEQAGDGPAQLRQQIDALEREHAQLQAELDPSPGGQQLARLALNAIDLRREADLAAAVTDALNFAGQITPAGTRVEVRPPESMIERTANGDVHLAATSDPVTGHIRLAVNAMDPTAKMGHEAVHTLVTMGHLSPDEVAALTALAREAGTFKNEAEYRQAYAGRDNLEQIIGEEAAASYIEARIRGGVDGPANTVVERIRQLLERIRRALAGYGFQSREDVVQAIMSGDVARRQARADWARNAQVQGRAAMKAAAERGATLPDGTQIHGVQLFAIRAFHGSPYDFDRFDISKIGTGEGAQAYGHGLYFAEAEDVAKDYRNKLGGAELHGSTGNVNIDSMLRRSFGGDWEKAKASGYIPAHEIARIEGEGLVPKATPQGRMYEVRINANPDDFLDWDKPLSQQSEKVRNALATQGINAPEKGATRAFDDALLAALEGDANVALPKQPSDPMGEAIVRQLHRKRGSSWLSPDTSAERASSDILREAGIPGIRYLDQGSRAAGEGSRNYVVFDDSLIEITHKDGQPVRTAADALRSEDMTAAVVKPDGQLFAFAGERAKTADLDKLRFAQTMEGMGAAREDVWRETGWFRGVDGRWRFEIDDSGSGRTWWRRGMLSDVLRHPELYAAYPDVAQTRTRRLGMFSSIVAAGSYDPAKPGRAAEIRYNGDFGKQGQRIFILHEAQHAVQDAEGFRYGAEVGQRVTPEQYERLAGEVEARAVETRANMTPEQRRARPPWLDYDVPEDQQIVRLPGDGEQLFSLRNDGLDMSPEARKARAKQMGFDTSRVWYHGTARDFSAFDLGKFGENTGTQDDAPAVFFTSSPKNASGYAEGWGGEVRDGANIRSVYLRSSNFDEWDLGGGQLKASLLQQAIAEAKADGRDGVIFRKALDFSRQIAAGGAASRNAPDVVAVFDPANIRSVNADFDPAKSGSAQLLASLRNDPPLKADMAIVDRMNRIGELISVCKG